MTHYQTSGDIIDDVLFRSGEKTDASSDFFDAAIRYVNRSYRAIILGGTEIAPSVNEDWWWSYADNSLIIQPKYIEGTISVTNNSASATLSDPPAYSLAGYHFKVDNHEDVFVISSHTGGATAVTLDSVYTGETAATAAYKTFKLDYTLQSDVQYITGPMEAYQRQTDVQLMDVDALTRDYPLRNVVGGTPTRFAMIGEQTVRFNKFGGNTATDLIRLDYRYKIQAVDLADDTNEPLVPLSYRHIIADMAAGHVLADKNDARAGAAFQLAAGGVSAMKMENRRRNAIGARDVGKIYPRQGGLHDGDGPIRTQAGLIIG